MERREWMRDILIKYMFGLKEGRWRKGMRLENLNKIHA